MSLGELLDLVERTLGCDPADAFRVAKELYVEGREDYSNEVIEYAAAKLGVESRTSASEDPAPPAPIMPQLTMDPAEVLAEVYKVMPRVLREHVPVIGRAPQDEEHKIPDELLEQLPEHIRVALMQVDVVNEAITVAFYDEANDVDMTIGPVDLARFESAQELHEAIEVLFNRLHKILPADFC